MTTRTAKVLSAGQGEWLSWLGHPVRYMATGEDTNEAYALSWDTVPAGGGPPAHRHTFLEGFFILKGEATFTAGNESVVLSAGGFINIGSGTAHYLRNHAASEAEVLVLVSPAGFDRFQREAGHRIASPSEASGEPGVDDFEKMQAIAPKFGIDLSPPQAAFKEPPQIKVTPSGEGRRIAVFRSIYRFLTTGDDTNGGYAIWEASVPPAGGPPLYAQSRENVGFYLLEGELTFQTDDQTIRATSGTFLNLPPGVRHTFRNNSQKTARMLSLVAPAGMERMFEETGVLLTETAAAVPPVSPVEIERLRATAPKYGIQIFPPAHA